MQTFLINVIENSLPENRDSTTSETASDGSEGR